MSAYQENFMKFGFFEAIQFCHTLIPVAGIHLEGDINSSSFAFKFWNFQHSELCNKSRAIFKIAEKRLHCDLQHNLTLRNENFYKNVNCFPHNELLVIHDYKLHGYVPPRPLLWAWWVAMICAIVGVVGCHDLLFWAWLGCHDLWSSGRGGLL